MATLASLGLSVTLPNGWDGRIYQRRAATIETQATTHPVLHAANFPLPMERGDFGSGAVERMGPDHVFVVLLEHHPATATTALFQQQGMALPLGTDCFSPAGLQRTLPGQSGAQFFFNEKGRAYSLYVVLGSHAQREQLVPLANSVLQTVEIAG